MSNVVTYGLIHQLQQKLQEAEWKQGEKGEKGDKGDTGDQGLQGRAGRDGQQGDRGADGVGADGADGKDGADGVGIEDIEQSADGDLVVKLTDSSEIIIEMPDLKGAGGDTYVINKSGGGGGTSGQLGGYLDLNNKGMVATFTAAEDLTGGDICRLNSSGEMAKANATTELTCSGLIGLPIHDVITGNVQQFLLRGFYDTAGFGTGDILYVDNVDGGVADFAPTTSTQIVRVLGYAVSPSQIFFDPDKTWIELA